MLLSVAVEWLDTNGLFDILMLGGTGKKTDCFGKRKASISADEF